MAQRVRAFVLTTSIIALPLLVPTGARFLVLEAPAKNTATRVTLDSMVVARRAVVREAWCLIMATAQVSWCRIMGMVEAQLLLRREVVERVVRFGLRLTTVEKAVKFLLLITAAVPFSLRHRLEVEVKAERSDLPLTITEEEEDSSRRLPTEAEEDSNRHLPTGAEGSNRQPRREAGEDSSLLLHPTAAAAAALMVVIMYV